MKWLIKEYMTKRRISSIRELAKITGIEYRTLINHISDAQTFRLYEIEALDEALGFSDEDLLKIVRGSR